MFIYIYIYIYIHNKENLLMYFADVQTTSLTLFMATSGGPISDNNNNNTKHSTMAD